MFGDKRPNNEDAECLMVNVGSSLLELNVNSVSSALTKSRLHGGLL